jgi:acylphosphatase
MVKSLSITVSGRVQGVFYRASAKKKADELNVHGFVRNEPNGNVFMEVSGEQSILDEFVAWCRIGPSHAEVTGCDVQEISAKVFTDFQVKRY